jgi:hypothetical protein
MIDGENGGLPKGFQKYLKGIAGKHSSGELQMAPILGTAHILRKFTSYKYFP